MIMAGLLGEGMDHGRVGGVWREGVDHGRMGGYGGEGTAGNFIVSSYFASLQDGILFSFSPCCKRDRQYTKL